jgi:chromosomal replication initiation ATPase DnaA
MIMSELKVKATSAEVGVDVLIETMINDIRQMDMDGLKGVFESMYPVVIEDVEGLEGEEVTVYVDFQEAPGADLEDIF